MGGAYQSVNCNECVCTWIDGYHLVTSRVVGEEGEIAHLLNKKVSLG